MPVSITLFYSRKPILAFPLNPHPVMIITTRHMIDSCSQSTTSIQVRADGALAIQSIWPRVSQRRVIRGDIVIDVSMRNDDFGKLTVQASKKRTRQCGEAESLVNMLIFVSRQLLILPVSSLCSHFIHANAILLLCFTLFIVIPHQISIKVLMAFGLRFVVGTIGFGQWISWIVATFIRES